jgi:hypothetical protein
MGKKKRRSEPPSESLGLGRRENAGFLAILPNSAKRKKLYFSGVAVYSTAWWLHWKMY